MSWAVGYDYNWHRDVGYGVPALCDHPDCDEAIDRGLGYVCGRGRPYGEDEGCGLFFCGPHGGGTLCERCENKQDDGVVACFTPKPDTVQWIQHKLTHESWRRWRDESPDEVKKIQMLIGKRER